MVRRLALWMSLLVGCGGSSETPPPPDSGVAADRAAAPDFMSTVQEDRPPAADMTRANDGPSDTAPAGSKAIGPAGGDHLVPGAGTSIPSGALTRETVISIRSVTAGYPALSADDTLLSSVYAFEPHGQTFARPVAVAIEYSGGAGGVVTFLTADPGGTWTEVPGATIQAAAVGASVTHFSFFAVTKRPRKALWEQVFGKWNCTANGRPNWSFQVLQKTPFGTAADWIDGATMVTGPASVTLTNLYLKTVDDKPYRNFEYKVKTSEVLDHLLEWTLTANGNAQYLCTKG